MMQLQFNPVFLLRQWMEPEMREVDEKSSLATRARQQSDNTSMSI